MSTRLLDRAGAGEELLSRESGKDLFARLCAPIGFDKDALLAAVAAFPVPRSVGQDTTSASWGESRVQSADWRSRYSVGLGFREGRTFRLALGPGIAVASSFDATRRERAWERDLVARAGEIEQVIHRPLFKPWRQDSGTPQATITEWSRRSRARMVKGFASVDWSGLSRCYCGSPVSECACGVATAMPLGMVTLTYPGDWLAVAPTGKAAKRHLALFRQRWYRAFGWRLDGAWKLEFQKPRAFGASEGQEAPHFHLLVCCPASVDSLGYDPGLGYLEPFWVAPGVSSWLSRTWADVVGAEGEERERHQNAGTDVSFGRTARMSDPKRCAVYFLKHGSKTLDDKEYQHTVPSAWAEPGKGPGRFWGFWGMAPATVAVDLDLDDWVTARRVLRHVAKARQAGVRYQRAKHAAVACGRPSWEVTKGLRYRSGVDLGPLGRRSRPAKLRTLGSGGQLSGGWVVVNDGPALAGALARAVNLRRMVVSLELP